MKFCIHRKLLLALISLLVASSASAASYSILPMIITFGRSDAKATPPGSHRTLTIRNTDKRPLYLALELEKRINPGRENETRLTLADTDPEEFGLILNNTRLIIPPGQERSVVLETLVNSERLTQDAVYRITTVPMESSKFVSESKTNVGGGIAMLLKYGIHVFIAPHNLNDSVKFSQKGSQVFLTNTGNSFNAVSAAYHCPRNLAMSKVTKAWQRNQPLVIKDRLKCEKVSGSAFLYAGVQLHYDIPEDKKLALVMYNGGKRQTEGFMTSENS